MDVAETLADAASQGLAVAPVGGGTSLALGNPPQRLDVGLSTTRLDGILAYEPTDLVVSVGAGALLADVQAVLAAKGQTLPIDPPEADGATIGGLIATGLAGPKRLSSGTLRDLLIGIAVAHPSGSVTKAGGMVVKNVTGFDLPRLYLGSLGTLGVVVSANFKVLPLPRADATFVTNFPSLHQALDAAQRVRSSRLQAAALEVAWLDEMWLAAVRLEGRETTVRSLETEVHVILGKPIETLKGAESSRWWESYVNYQAPRSTDGEILLRCDVRPRATGDLARGIVGITTELGLRLAYLAASVGTGSVVARLTFPQGTGSAFALQGLQNRLLAVADHATILASPTEWKHGLDIWGRPPDALDVMRALKEQFDPWRVLNPGRFAGGI